MRTRMQEGLLLGVAILLVAGALTAVTSPGTVESDSPNIILISVDTMRADHLPCYGYLRNTTPHLCRLAERSILFENAITQAPWSLPSYASLLTSQYPSVHGAVEVAPGTVDAERILLPEMLQQKGYRTAAFVGSVQGRNDSLGGHLRPELGFNQGFDTYHAPESTSTPSNPLPETRYLSHTVPEALNWTARNGDEPFFLFLHGYEPHEYLGGFTKQFSYPNSTRLERFRQTYPLSIRKNLIHYLQRTEDGPAIVMENTTIPLNETDIRHIRGTYDSRIRLADEWIGTFLHGLRNQGLYQDTVIVVISDHGEILAEHTLDGGRLFGHAGLHTGVVHVPLIMKLPGHTSQRISRPVELIDIAPTLLAATDIRPDSTGADRMQGDSLLPLLSGQNTDTFRYAFTEAVPGTETGSVSLRTASWALIDHPPSQEPDELYNRDTDPNETRNLIDIRPDIAQRLRDQIADWRLRNQQHSVRTGTG